MLFIKLYLIVALVVTYMNMEYHNNRFFKSFGILSFAAWKGHTVIVELLILKQSWKLSKLYLCCIIQYKILNIKWSGACQKRWGTPKKSSNNGKNIEQCHTYMPIVFILASCRSYMSEICNILRSAGLLTIINIWNISYNK